MGACSIPLTMTIKLTSYTSQKNRDGMAWFARRASSWLLKKVRERKSVRGQANEETCKSTRNWKAKEPGEVSLVLSFFLLKCDSSLQAELRH